MHGCLNFLFSKTIINFENEPISSNVKCFIDDSINCTLICQGCEVILLTHFEIFFIIICHHENVYPDNLINWRINNDIVCPPSYFMVPSEYFILSSHCITTNSNMITHAPQNNKKIFLLHIKDFYGKFETFLIGIIDL